MTGTIQLGVNEQLTEKRFRQYEIYHEKVR